MSLFFSLLLCNPISLCVCRSFWPSPRSSFLVPISSLFLYELCLCLSLVFCLCFSLSDWSLSSSLAPPQVTVGTGLRLPMVPALGACGSSSSTLKQWAQGPSFSRPSLCTAAPSPRSCSQRSTSSQVGLAGLSPLPVSLQDGGPEGSVKPGSDRENFNLEW